MSQVRILAGELFNLSFIMRKCLNCDNNVPNYIKIDGKKRNLKNRRYCLLCSPFGEHNAKKLHDAKSDLNRVCRICYKEYLGGHRQYKDVCPSCRVSESRRNKKIELINYKGGKCQICNYDRCKRVLQFHHIDPELKEFELSNSGTMNIEILKKEADKCILVCANCHGEIHEGLINLNNFV